MNKKINILPVIISDNCKKVAIAFDDVVSSIEFVNCQSIQAQVSLTSRKHLRTKVTPDWHLTVKKTGEIWGWYFSIKYVMAIY